MDMGGAPPRTNALIGPAAFRDVQKTDCLKRRASDAPSFSSGALTLLNMAWTSVELVEATLPVFAATPYNARRSAGRSSRNQPSEGV